MPAVETGPHAPGPQPTAPSGRPHKRVHWRQPPAGKKRRPGVLDAARAELVRGLGQRRGSLWMRISRNVIVAGYALEKALTRVRALRSDGADSLLAMSVALLYLTDVRTGFVGKPAQSGGRWQRYTLHDLAQLAYGGQAEAEIRRARRSLDMMVSLGWAFPTKQVRRHKTDAQGGDLWRSEPAVRRLNLQRLCHDWHQLVAQPRPPARRPGARVGRGVLSPGASTASASPAAQQRATHGVSPANATPSHGRPTGRCAERRPAYLRHPRPVQIADAGRLGPAQCRRNRAKRRQ